MRRIGIIGGTFNPVHVGHLATAQAAKETVGMDEVIFVPSQLPPHKSGRGVVPSRHRLNMVRLAIRGNAGFRVSDYEAQKEGKTYTIDTLEHFRGKYPKGTRFYFIVGEDMVAGLKRWRRVGDILKIARFVMVSRPGYTKKKTSIPCRSVSMPGIDISSTDLRRRMSLGKTVKYLIPLSVEQYIAKNRLYYPKKSKK